MCEALSSNHFSLDQQAVDVVSHLRHATKVIEGHEVGHLRVEYARFREAFPEWDRLQFGICWVDTEASHVDPDYMCWAVDWLEDNVAGIAWVDGEPYQVCRNDCIYPFES